MDIDATLLKEIVYKLRTKNMLEAILLNAKKNAEQGHMESEYDFLAFPAEKDFVLQKLVEKKFSVTSSSNATNIHVKLSWK